VQLAVKVVVHQELLLVVLVHQAKVMPVAQQLDMLHPI
jgi:hypothetical protein